MLDVSRVIKSRTGKLTLTPPYIVKQELRMPHLVPALELHSGSDSRNSCEASRFKHSVSRTIWYRPCSYRFHVALSAISTWFVMLFRPVTRRWTGSFVYLVLLRNLPCSNNKHALFCYSVVPYREASASAFSSSSSSSWCCCYGCCIFVLVLLLQV